MNAKEKALLRELAIGHERDKPANPDCPFCQAGVRQHTSRGNQVWHTMRVLCGPRRELRARSEG
jgi:hypothetical protein